MSLFEAGRRVHVIGVGGAGMSSLARLLVERGCAVTGSDAQDSEVLAELSGAGVRVSVGHRAANVADAELVTWSPAVKEDNVELVAARRRSLTLVPRALALASLVQDQATIGLAGTHGKTTATSMSAMILDSAGLDYSRLIGAPVRGLGPGGHWGPHGLLLEVDESYGTFEEMAPSALGLLNVEADHLDHYGTDAALESAFARLAERVSGPVVAWDEPGNRRSLARVNRDVIWVGENDHEDWRVGSVRMQRRGASFELLGDTRVELELAVTGRHNVANAALSAALALVTGIEVPAVAAGLARFSGAPRRFDLRGHWRSADVYEDYAHLPGEVAAALAGARSAGYRDVTAVFQPHRYTRTARLASNFADSFLDAQRLVVLDVYSAGESDPGGVDGRLVLDAVREAHPEMQSEYVARREDLVAYLASLPDVGDAVILIGAGDVGELASDLVETR